MKSSIKIEIDDLTEMEDWVESLVKCKVTELFEKKMDEAIEEAVDAAANVVISDKLRAQAEDIIEKGWVETDQYGKPKGERRTLRDMMTDALTKATGDHYSSNREPLVAKILKETLSAAITANFANDISAAQKQLKAMLDAEVKTKLATALKQALGLPTS